MDSCACPCLFWSLARRRWRGGWGGEGGCLGEGKPPEIMRFVLNFSCTATKEGVMNGGIVSKISRACVAWYSNRNVWPNCSNSPMSLIKILIKRENDYYRNFCWWTRIVTKIITWQIGRNFKLFENESPDTDDNTTSDNTTNGDKEHDVATWAAGCDIMNCAAAMGLNPGWGGPPPPGWRGYPGGWRSKRASEKVPTLKMMNSSITFIGTFVRSKVVAIHHWRMLESWELKYFYSVSYFTHISKKFQD